MVKIVGNGAQSFKSDPVPYEKAVYWTCVFYRDAKQAGWRPWPMVLRWRRV